MNNVTFVAGWVFITVIFYCTSQNHGFLKRKRKLGAKIRLQTNTYENKYIFNAWLDVRKSF